MPAGVILGSAFGDGSGLGELVPVDVPTRFGAVVLHRHVQSGGFVLFRHGAPHRHLPHQIPWRAHALALKAMGVHALLVTSSVGVLDPSVPMNAPHLVADLMMTSNQLGDGSPCTLWTEHHPEQGHLVLEDGLFNGVLGDWLAGRVSIPTRRLVFAYVPGPRTKTRAENGAPRATGAEVNSMSVGPEVVLANELEIPTVALVTGHKASRDGGGGTQAEIARSLDDARAANLQAIRVFLQDAPAVAFGNFIYRFGER